MPRLRQLRKRLPAGRMWAVARRDVGQGAPVRSRQKIPFSTRRSSTRSLPRTSVGNSGSITAHSASVRSNRAIHDPPSEG